MRRFRAGLAGLVATALLTAAGPAAQAADVSRIERLRYDPASGKLLIEANGPVRFRTTRLTAPERLVVDFEDAELAGPIPVLGAVAGTAVTRVRAGQFQARVARVVLDLARPVGYDVVADAGGASIAIGGSGGQAAMATPVVARPTVTGIQAGRSGIVVSMDRRVPYWSYAALGRPHRYLLVFPGAQLGNRLPDTGAGGPGSDVTRWKATEEGGDARIEFELKEAPTFAPRPLARGWSFDAQGDPTARPPWQAAHVDGANLTFRKAGSSWLLTLSDDARLRYHVTPAGNDRLHVDLYGAKLSIPRDSVYIDNGLIARVQQAPGPAGGTRLTVDFDAPVRHQAGLTNAGRSLQVRLWPQAQAGVTVDPGHGGSDHGALGKKGTREKDVTLAIASRLSRIMATNGLSVQMTRMKDLEILLRPRVELANRANSDVFISIHANSFPGAGVKGIETYYYADSSRPLAAAIQRHLVASLGRPDRGVRKNNFYVVHHTKMPAALVEIGYLSNPEEEALLTSPAYQERAAQAIYAGIREFLKQRRVKP